MALRICLSLPVQGPYPQNKSSNCSSFTKIFSPCFPINKEAVPLPLSVCCSIRRRNIAILTLLLHWAVPNTILASQQEELEIYADASEGFTLLRPSSYVKVDKAGATVLFEEGSNNIGVVVNPVRITNIAEFGTPQFVADKLIQAERRKESTKSAEVIRVGERTGHGGEPVYEFEYVVDSTRGGMKRVFSAAFVASKKLYLLNITHSDKTENPLDSNTRTLLEQVLHSFDIPSSSA